MNIVTIFDYNTSEKNHITMIKMLISSIKENCKKSTNINLYVITSYTNLSNYISEEIEILPLKKFRTNKKVHKNILSKLYNLCNLDFEFIFLDYDMYVCADLEFLWEKRKDKPFIGTIHQKNINGKKGVHTTKNSNFLNSGLQIVSDPDFLNYKEIFQFGEKMNFDFPVSGYDQALLDSYFKNIGYNFSHKDVGCQWNSCAGYGIVHIDDDYKFEITYKNQREEYPVMINHYWDEFKPWNINCPIFNFYKKFVL